MHIMEQSPDSQHADEQQLLAAQQAYVRNGSTRSLQFRKEQLRALKSSVEAYESRLLDALAQDLGKSEFEGYSSEIGLIYREIRYILKRLPRWMRPRKTSVEFFLRPGSGRIYREPYGSTLIISPWNYPVQLLLLPLIGAVAGGNTAVVKPSETAAASESVIRDMISSAFDRQYIAVETGGAEKTARLAGMPFDKIFFTGSVRVGKLIMQSAVQHLTPVTLELGGKSPAVIAEDADLPLAARKIVWGKFLNAGQTCVAPDYVLVPETQHKAFMRLASEAVRRYYGEHPESSPSYGRIITEAHVERLALLLEGQQIFYGGAYDRRTRYIAPTILDTPSWEDPVMQEEIFGPILPVIPYSTLDEVLQQIRSLPTPLAFYLFTRSRNTKTELLKSLSFGTAGVNCTVLQVASSALPFGGAGTSGMGEYHGKASFEAFTRRKPVLTQPARIDLSLTNPKLQPSMKWLRRIMK